MDLVTVVVLDKYVGWDIQFCVTTFNFMPYLKIKVVNNGATLPFPCREITS